MSYRPVEIDGIRRRLLCPPIYRRIDGAGRVYVGLSYAGKEVLAHVTYPQDDDKGQYVQIGRPTLPRFDPSISEKIVIADAARRLAAYLVADDNNDGNTMLAKYFKVHKVSSLPGDDDERVLFKILDNVLEAELFQVDGIIADVELDDIEKEERKEAYLRQAIDDEIETYGCSNLQHNRLWHLVTIAKIICWDAKRNPTVKNKIEMENFLYELDLYLEGD